MTIIKKFFFIFIFLGLSSCGTLSFLNMDKDEIELSLTASRQQIEAGQSVTLQWKSKNAETLRIMKVAEDLPESGSIEVTPKHDERYLLIGSKPKKIKLGDEKKNKAYSSVRINVVKPKVEFFNATKEKIFYGDPASVSWETHNARYVSIPGIADSLPPEGSFKWAPDTTDWYHLVAHGQQITEKDSVQVNVRLRKRFKTPDKIWLGDTLHFKWQIDRSDYVIIPGMGKFSAKGSKSVFAGQDTTITLIAHREYGAVDTLTRKVKVDTPKIRYFYGPSKVLGDEKASLSWKVDGNPGLKIVGRIDSLPPKSSISLPVNQDTTFTLQATYPTFSTSVDLEVNVLAHRGYVTDTLHRKNIPAGRRVDFDILEMDTTQLPKRMKLKVIAVDEQGNFIRGINQHNVSQHIARLYQSTHGGTLEPFSYNIEYKQELKYKKVDFGFAFDFSGSMYGKVGALMDAAEMFLQKKYPDDRISMVKFDGELKKETALLADKEGLLKSLKRNTLSEMGGSTALYAGTSMGLKTLKASNRKRILILFTDGHENSSFAYLGEHATSAVDLAQEARMLGIPLYIISYGLGTNTSILQALSEATYGQYYQLLGTSQIPNVFEEIRRVMREYYEITFKPLPYDGKHFVRLDYYNNSGGISTAKTTFTRGGKLKLNGKETTKDTYWKPGKGKHAVMPPQVIATFDFDKDKLKPKFHDRVDKFIKYLKDNQNLQITIHGHTDQVGDWEYCIDLSKRRAEAVADYIKEQGIEEGRIKTEGWGMEYPKWHTENTEWKARENRRIEVVVYE